MVQPDVAVFGRKDYQQLQVIRYMATRNEFSGRDRAAPTLREPDGLAMSSRNQYLQGDERKTAAASTGPCAPCATNARRQGHCGDRGEAEAAAGSMAGFSVDYAEIRRSDLIAPGRPTSAACWR